MDSRGIRLGLAIGTTAIVLSLNAVAVVTGRAEHAYEQLTELYNEHTDTSARPEGAPPINTRYAAACGPRKLAPAPANDRGSGDKTAAEYIVLALAPTPCVTTDSQG